MIATVTTTVSTATQANALAATMVERRLAACAQLTPIESFYIWDGALRHEPEVRVVFKTTTQLQAALMEAVVESHPYEVPDVHAETLSMVHEPYADWVAASVGSR